MLPSPPPKVSSRYWPLQSNVARHCGRRKHQGSFMLRWNRDRLKNTELARRVQISCFGEHVLFDLNGLSISVNTAVCWFLVVAADHVAV